MKWPLMITVLALCFVAYSPVASAAQALERPSSSNQEDFTNGYRQGYDQGFHDMRSGSSFDYESTDAYQTGTNDFQLGFHQGYSDAFSGHDRQIDPVSRDSVEVFSATGFRGNVMVLGIGGFAAINLDDVESLRIHGNVRVIVFNRPNFEGRSVTLTADTPNLRDLQENKAFRTFGLVHHTGSMIIEPLR